MFGAVLSGFAWPPVEHRITAGITFIDGVIERLRLGYFTGCRDTGNYTSDASHLLIVSETFRKSTIVREVHETVTVQWDFGNVNPAPK